MSSAGSTEGLLLVDKPPGPSSHDVVREARRALDVRRVGHTGTLDPFASGLLLLMLGRATRLAQYLDDFPKTYEAEARVGLLTTTLDPEGEVVEERGGWEELDAVRVRQAMAALTGPGRQIPPAFSAKKVKGEAAYRRARRGEAVELKPVSVVIHELVLLELALPRIRFRVRCSTGTYVRAVARDLGQALGTVAHLTALRRTAIGPFRVEDALPVAELGDAARVGRARVTPLEALAHLPRVEVSASEAGRLGSGQALPLGTAGPSAREDAGTEPAEGTLVVVAREGDLVAVAQVAGGLLKPRKVFAGV